MAKSKQDLIQLKAVKAIANSLKKSKRALVEMATGTGKTRTAINLIKNQFKNKKVLWLTHRNNLVSQTSKVMTDQKLPDVGLYALGMKDVKQITIASIPTVSRPKTFDSFKKFKFDLVIFDEAHHTPATSWKKLADNYKKTQLLGLTATPERPDGAAIEEVFGERCFTYDFHQAVKDGVISAPIAYSILTEITVNGLTKLNKDYTPKQLDRFFTVDKRNKIIVDSYMKDAKPKVKQMKLKPKALCFCINTDHAKIMRDEFRARGITSEILVGNATLQSKDERQRIEKTFHDTNEIEVLCVIDIFNEGVDVPDINVGLMCRPTSSCILYQQQIGRLCRKVKNKKRFILLDFVDNNKDFGSYTASTQFKGATYFRPKVIRRYIQHLDKVIRKEIEANFFKNVLNFKEKFRIKNITEENLKYMIKYGKVDDRIYG